MSDVVLLPGMMCDARLWRFQSQALIAQGHHVSCGDLSSADSIQELARLNLALCPKRFALVGLSMGGIVAFEMWRQAADRITHLALFDTNPHAEAAERKVQRAAEMSQVQAGGLHLLVVEAMKPRYLGARQRDNASLRELVTSMALELGPAVYQRQAIALRDRCDSTQTLASITVPTLVLCGKQDELCPPHYHQLMAQHIAPADLVMLAESGHLPPLEQPEATAQELLRWLARTR